MSTRPERCCGVCPSIVGGGYDCTCAGNRNCPNWLKDVRTAFQRASVCHEEVSRNHESQPCHKPAVALKVDEEGGIYPVCAYHSHGNMVLLMDIQEAKP